MTTNHTHIIDTPVGTFRFHWINLELKGKANKSRRWIAGRFDNVGAAKAYFSCNQFTGKYNFHDEPLKTFSRFLETIRCLEMEGK